MTVKHKSGFSSRTASGQWPASAVDRLTRALHSLLVHPQFFWAFASLVVIGDAVLTELIVHLVPYTEIDWKTYMAQIEVFLKGQHNYSKITGPTGPLVYPAGHIHLHRFLHSITSNGENIQLAQHVYALLYVVSLSFTCAIYHRTRAVPNWIVLILPFSKRLHSIFVLRLFNDCWSVVALQASVLAYQEGLDVVGTLLFSTALSIKMSILLYLPGLLVILFKRQGLSSTIRHLGIIFLTQTLVALPFLLEDPWAYLHFAFDLSRVFLYKWTVNWKFLAEETFLSSRWASSLLMGHTFVLVAFGLFRWCRSEGSVGPVLVRGFRRPGLPAGLRPLTGDYIATVLFTSNLVGILFARSLHYQFYSWYAQQIPFLTWKTRYPIIIKFVLLFSIEYAWNVFPSTPLSSATLLATNMLLLAGVWCGASNT